MLAPHANDRLRRSGAALLIVLAFVVLLTVVVFAFFSRATMARQTSKSTAAETAATILARSSLATVVSDLREEIAEGGTPTVATIGPQRSGAPSSGTPPRFLIPNLVRISLSNDAILSPGVASRASAVNSTANIAANGRYVSRGRWNSHYVIPKINTGDDSSEPIAEFSAPDWVIVTRNGPTPFTTMDAGLKNSSSNTYALGRYAYAVYDEGGLLDVNVAGCPTDFSPDQVGAKGILAFADLPTAGVSSWQSDNIVGWRNYATLKPAGYFSSLSSASKSRFLPFGGLTGYFTLVTTRTNDFLKVAGATYNAQTDQAIADRQQLIKLRRSLGFSVNALQNFGTFSRERNKPTWQDSATRLAGRFPLSRFDLFANPPGNKDDIKKYFGLQYVPASDTTPEHWKYIGAEGSDDVLQPSIYNLTGNGQDPDLSVLLRYAYNVGTSTDETRAMLSIMASLIDQRDLNDNTTWIEFSSAEPAATRPEKAWGADKNPPSPEPGAPSSGVVVLNRQFRNVGELGYGYRNGSTSLDFQSSTSIDARLLDLFTYSSVGVRAGLVNFNTQNGVVLAAILQGTTDKEQPTRLYFPGTRSSTSAKNAGQDIVAATSPLNPPATSSASVSRADIPKLVAKIRSSALGSSAEEKEVIARAFAELTQTRTWNLMIDVIAQSGRYPPNAGTLADFVVQGEKRYWLHIAIDRFTGQVIDQQLEAVYE
jgi:hypothetical protein